MYDLKKCQTLKLERFGFGATMFVFYSIAKIKQNHLG